MTLHSEMSRDARAKPCGARHFSVARTTTRSPVIASLNVTDR